MYPDYDYDLIQCAINIERYYYHDFNKDLLVLYCFFYFFIFLLFFLQISEFFFLGVLFIKLLRGDFDYV